MFKFFCIFRMHPTSLGERSLYLNKVQSNPHFKGAYGISKFKVLYLNQKRDEESNYKICRENFLTIPVVIYTRRDFYLLGALNSKIDRLKSAGIIEFWQEQEVDIKLLNQKESTQPRTLTISQFHGSFQVLLMGLMTSFVMFLIEMLSQNFKLLLPYKGNSNILSHSHKTLNLF